MTLPRRNILSLLFVSGSLCLLPVGVASALDCKAPHQVLSETTPVCPVTCQNMNGVRCLAIAPAPSCQCDKGFVRKSATDATCVPLNQCEAQTKAK